MRRLDCLLMSCCLIACDGDTPATTPDADVSVSETQVDTHVPIDTSGGRSLTANDVSILFPIAAPTALWSASDAGLGGVLLPRAQFDAIGRSLMMSIPTETEYDALRVVAARFDDCFRVAHGGRCQPQIRLVLQGIDETGAALDGAIHALYNVDDLTTIVAELRAVSALAPENLAATPLGVSPALTAQGVDGVYGVALKSLITRHIGEQNLARMTFMTRTDVRSGQWEFGGFHIGTWDEFPAPGVIGIFGAFATLQTITRRMGASGFEYELEPTFAQDVGGPASRAEDLLALDAETRADVHAWAIRQEDPAVELADTTDCASCHLAGRAGRFLEEIEPSLLTSDLLAQRAPRVIGEAGTNADNLRAFGWFANWPEVSQRVANETALVVDAMNALGE